MTAMSPHPRASGPAAGPAQRRPETRDPIGFAVAALNRLAQSDLLDRLGLRKQTERAVFAATRSGFRRRSPRPPGVRPGRASAASPAPGRRPPPPRASST